MMGVFSTFCFYGIYYSFKIIMGILIDLNLQEKKLIKPTPFILVPSICGLYNKSPSSFSTSI
jgi:hypothetical protein